MLSKMKVATIPAMMAHPLHTTSLSSVFVESCSETLLWSWEWRWRACVCVCVCVCVYVTTRKSTLAIIASFFLRSDTHFHGYAHTYTSAICTPHVGEIPYAQTQVTGSVHAS